MKNFEEMVIKDKVAVIHSDYRDGVAPTTVAFVSVDKGLSDEEKDGVADEILLGTPDEYENDFNYFVNLGFRDFLLKDLGIDGIQFFNAIEDKLKSDWSYIILDGSQFKNIKQRKKAGQGFDKSKRPHMSKYNKQNKYRKVS